MAYIMTDEGRVEEPRKSCMVTSPRSPRKKQNQQKNERSVRFLEVIVQERTLLREHGEKIRKRKHHLYCDRLKEQQAALEDRLMEIQAQHQAEMASIQSEHDLFHQEYLLHEGEHHVSQQAIDEKHGHQDDDSRNILASLRRENALLQQQHEKLERNTRNLRCNNMRLEKALVQKAEQMEKLRHQHERIEHKHKRLVKQEQSLKQQVDELQQDFDLMERHLALDAHMHQFYQGMIEKIVHRVEDTERDPSLVLKVLEYAEYNDGQSAEKNHAPLSSHSTQNSFRKASSKKCSLHSKKHHGSHRSHAK